MTAVRLKKWARGALMIAASSAVLVTVAPSPAHAADDHAWVWAQNDAGTYNAGVAETWSYGENLVVEDFHADGWGVRAQLQTLEYAPEGYRYWAAAGAVCFDDTSTGNSIGGRTTCNREVAEGKTFRIHIWASQSGSTKWHGYSPSIVA
ncbi:hypothetical protein [Catellatospora chokoriensis]|uniref:Secreted protein n=1 Tax=Catellatospora chokoriensis TaxID=310353 RepID=A0A8J3KBD6_9ACTN|nr:hypothetical protein [Catellatospora chokoriensis]GIF93603.1 hypothetical protein Cch02nite_70470 [Catellatospora chokoriensis]